MTHPSYRACLDRGLTATQTAAARGVDVSNVYKWAKRNGVVFRRDYAGHASRLRALHRDPVWARALVERRAASREKRVVG